MLIQLTGRQFVQKYILEHKNDDKRKPKEKLELVARSSSATTPDARAITPKTVNLLLVGQVHLVDVGVLRAIIARSVQHKLTPREKF